MKGGCLDGGGEGSEGRVLDCSHDRAAICLQCGQNKGICLDDLRLYQDLRGKGRRRKELLLYFALASYCIDPLGKKEKIKFS